MIVMREIFERLYTEQYFVMQWNTQSGSITTNIKVKANFTLPALSATNFMT